MALDEDIREAGRRALTTLDVVHDSHAFSLQAWDALNPMATAGEPLLFQNPATGTTLDENTVAEAASSKA